jgi:hypothetical protein
VFPRADGRWVVRVKLPRSYDGKRRRIQTMRGNQDEAERELKRLQAKVAVNGDVRLQGKSLEDWVQYWIKYIAAKRVEPATLTGHEGRLIRHVLPCIGRRRA